MKKPNPVFETITDIDGNIYKMMEIGNKMWMAENLNVSHYCNGDPILQVQDGKEWAKLTTGGWCYYENNEEYGKTYSKLYNWKAVNDSRGLAPEGWHIPTDDKWTILADYLGGETVAGGKMKEAGTTHWNSPNMGAINSSGYWCSSTESNDSDVWYWDLYFSLENFDRYGDLKCRGFSVRCVRD